MREKQGAGLFIEIFVIMAILGVLSAIAIPNVGQLISKGRLESGDSELHNIQTAVVEMLAESSTGTLEPVGPTADMSKVRTSDTPPLVLTDYLIGLDEGSVKLEYTYAFAADGTVTQMRP